MFGRKQLLEERIGAAIRAEFAGLISELEKDLREYRHRSRLKEEALDALESAEAEARKKHLRRVELKKRFWEAYYANDEAALSEIGRKHKSLEGAIKKAEKSLKKARADFEKIDFDEAAEGTALRKKAETAEEKADLRIGVLEETIEGLLAETWRNVKGAGRALRDECEEPRSNVSKEDASPERRSA